MHLALPATVPEPFVAVDERALVLYDGRRAVMLGAALFAWVRATLAILLEEGRATRVQSDRVLGGFSEEESVILYAGTHAELITLQLDRSQVRELLDRLGTR